MGKSTTARFFAEEGVPLHDADAAVHRLYEGEVIHRGSRRRFLGTTSGGRVDRDKLAKKVLGDSAAIKKLETIIHPLVGRAEGLVFWTRPLAKMRQWWCSIYRYCLKPAPTEDVMRWSSSLRRRTCSEPGRLSVPE